MAKALVKYETIDETQIKDIMEGREPQPPEDWEEPAEPRGGKPKSKKDVKPAIGGPATEN